MERSTRNYSWAIFLVLVGILFLLNTTGLIGWGIWEYIVRFWPVLIILVGIKIILGESSLAKGLEIFFTVLLTVSVFTLAYIQYTASGISFIPKGVNDWVLEGGSGPFNFSRDTVKDEIVVTADEYIDITKRNLNIDVGSGELEITEDSIDEYIYIKQEYPNIHRESELEKSVKDGILDLTFTSATPKTFNMFPNESFYEISLGQLEIPTSIDIVLGAGDGDIFFEKLPLDDFYTKVGAGNLDVTFGKDSIPSGDMFIDIGAGKMTLTIPERVGYILDYDLGVGKIEIDGKDIAEFSSSKEYTSSNYQSADIKIKMVVSVGVGSFTLESN